MSVYLPSHFKVETQEQIVEIMNRYPFATLISQAGGELVISHLPLVVKEHKDDIFLIGHMAAANPHAKILDQAPLTIIFEGPHTYINSSWYKSADVPTWNYVRIHVKAKATILTDHKEILRCLKMLNYHTRDLYNENWEFWLPKDLENPQLLSSAIIGFKCTVETYEAKFKLNQNRSQEDQVAVIEGLRKRGDEMSHRIADLMDRKVKS